MVLMETGTEDLFKAALKQGILERHHEELCEILFAIDTGQHYSVVMDIMSLIDSFSSHPAAEAEDENGSLGEWWSLLAQSPHRILPIFDAVIQDAQVDLIQMNEQGQRDLDMRMQMEMEMEKNGQEGSSRPQEIKRRMTPMYLKTKCSARIMGLPAAESRRMTIPVSADVGKFLSITATVIRTGVVKMLENSKRVYCGTCRGVFEVFADVEQYNQVVMPTRCLVKGFALGKECPGSKFQMIETEPGELPVGCRDYQEIKIQEQTNKLSMGTIPGSMVVILHDDLVDHAKSGDDVTITGTVIRRWKPTMVGERCDIELALLANHVYIHNEQRVGVGVTEEQRVEFEQYWERARDPHWYQRLPESSRRRRLPILPGPRIFTARNRILAQICPKVYGLYIVKLAVMLILTGGVQKVDKSGLKVRGEPHLLLVGDPGTGKSQFLKYAAELNPRSVLTTGIGSSSAGLTVTAVRDGNEWQLEAGALVLADRGLCCIDEFGGMREHDKTAIHEAMEQQSISIAKAGIVCKLNTRCSVIAATNPKGKYDPDQSVSINIALASPLLSRFDIVLVLMDTGNENWDQKISSFILETRMRIDHEGVPGYAGTRKRTKKQRKEAERRKRHKLKRMVREERMRRRQQEMEAAAREGAEHDGGFTSPIVEEEEDEEDSNDPDQEDDDDDDDEDEEEDTREPPWTLDKLKAYLIWIKSTFQPKLTPPAEQVLVSYYQLQRKADIRNAARTTIRLLESLIRLSQAHARMMAKDWVTVEDAVVVVSLMEATAQGGAAMLGGVNPLHASFPKSAEEEYFRQEEAMLGRLGLGHLASERVGQDGGEDEQGEGRSGPIQQEAEGIVAESMILDDEAEEAILERYRRADRAAERDQDQDDGLSGLDFAMVKEEEETLIDRRPSRRRQQQEKELLRQGKGKGVSKEHVNYPGKGGGGVDGEDEDEDQGGPYGHPLTGQGSLEF